MTFPKEYRWIKKKLRAAFPKFKIFGIIREIPYTSDFKTNEEFSFKIRDKHLQLHKTYSINFLKQRNAPVFVDRVIERWKEIIKSSFTLRINSLRHEIPIFKGDFGKGPVIYCRYGWKKIPIKRLGDTIKFTALKRLKQIERDSHETED